MKKTAYVILGISIILAGIVLVQKTSAQKEELQKRNVKIEGATPENPVVYLGKSFDKKSGKMVDGYAIVHYARNASKPAKPSSGTTCYSYIAKGAKWKTNEPWVVDSVNTGRLDSNFILQNMKDDIAKWEIASGADNDILGEGKLSETPITISSSLDNKNEATFAPIDNAGAIAVTYIWGYFSGPMFQRELVEWDQVYDDVDFDWSMTGEADKIDFENIATHELGHSVGMGDLYTSRCSDQTMYGYAAYGETNKRSLESGDIAGIDLLY